MLYTKDTAVLSITELTQSIKSVLELQYRFVHIHGEVSNLHVPYSGHMYFTLKDSGAQIRAVMFKAQRRYLAENIKEGQSIICHGRISVYEQRGEYQIIIDTVDFKGTGNLRLQYERLKGKLAEEGLFKKENKKNIPIYPEHIFLVTSPTGAAVYDFLKISTQRQYWGNITIVPVTVQGKTSADEIVEALDAINDGLKGDIIVIIRGGGSLEDLWSFNEEKVARAIFRSTIPVVTGIGHETDFTIADLCADLQTHTPTASAEATIPNCQLLLDSIFNYRKYLVAEILQYISEKEEFIRQHRRIIGDLDLFLSNHNLQLDYQISSLIKAINSQLSNISTEVKLCRDKLHGQAPLTKIFFQEQSIEHLRANILQRMSILLERKQSLLGKQAAVMESVSPLSILARGYSVVSKIDKNSGEKEIISNSNQVARGDLIDVRLNTGELTCQVKTKRR